MSNTLDRIRPTRPHRNPLGVLAVSVFLNVTGFTLIDPVIPSLVAAYEPRRLALFVGLIISIYAACEFVAAPLLGACSDRFGRKPLLLVSLAGSAIGYVIFGIGGAMWMLFLGRIIDGLSAGNISVMYACVADLTPPRERARVYGMLGAVGGAGFMLGPVIGGLLGQRSPSAPLFAAAALTAVNIVWVIAAVPESLAPTKRSGSQRWQDFNPLAQFSYAFSFRMLRFIFIPAFLFFLAGAMMQGNISVFLTSVMRFGPLGIGLVLFLVGMLDMPGPRRPGAPLAAPLRRTSRCARWPSAEHRRICGACRRRIAAGNPAARRGNHPLHARDGLFQPSSSALIANAAPPDTQGRIQGANQGQQSIARMASPLLAAAAASLEVSAPDWGGAAIVAVALIATLRRPPATRRE